MISTIIATATITFTVTCGVFYFLSGRYPIVKHKVKLTYELEELPEIGSEVYIIEDSKIDKFKVAHIKITKTAKRPFRILINGYHYEYEDYFKREEDAKITLQNKLLTLAESLNNN